MAPGRTIKELRKKQYGYLSRILELCCDAEDDFTEYGEFFVFENVRKAAEPRYMELIEIFGLDRN